MRSCDGCRGNVWACWVHLFRLLPHSRVISLPVGWRSHDAVHLINFIYTAPAERLSGHAVVGGAAASGLNGGVFEVGERHGERLLPVTGGASAGPVN